jgi:hypothetical protein
MATKTTGDARTRRTEGASTRSSREALADESRRGDDLLSEDDLRRMIRDEFVQEALPQIKPPPGWHYCWLSTTSQHDPIHKRLRVGYQAVPFSELTETGQDAGFESYKVAAGDFAGCVSCNELVLFKITNRRYQMIMSEFHHRMPLGEEESLRAKATTGEKDSSGKKLVNFDTEDEGMKELGKAPAIAPEFA